MTKTTRKKRAKHSNTKRTPPTPKQQELHDLCIKLHGSVSRTAREADVHYSTLAKRIFETVPESMHNSTIVRLEGVGIPRGLLLP